MSPYRTAAVVEKTPPETLRITRMGNWNDNKHFAVDWVEGSNHVEVSIHDGSGAARQRVRIHVDAAQMLMSAIALAIGEAGASKRSTP